MYVFDFEEFSMSKKHNSNNDWIFMDPELILGVEPVCCTGKSLSEVLIYSSINPQYDYRLFNDLQVQYEKITRAENVKNILFTQIV